MAMPNHAENFPQAEPEEVAPMRTQRCKAPKPLGIEGFFVSRRSNVYAVRKKILESLNEKV
jgi:hypothetical protein